MILYFSGTGNSKYCAQILSNITDDKAVDIAKQVQNGENNIELSADENLGIVFPIYCWDAPSMVKEYLHRVNIKSFGNYTYIIMTCGEDSGYAHKGIIKTLNRFDLNIAGLASIKMPDNFIPMYDLKPMEDSITQLEQSTKSIEEIGNIIASKMSFNKIRKKSFSLAKTYLLAPLFNVFAVNPKKFYTTDKCNLCSICIKNCPTKNISIEDEKTVWKDDCTKCLACIHRCPRQAIQYGKKTINRGRYYNPLVK